MPENDPSPQGELAILPPRKATLRWWILRAIIICCWALTSASLLTLFAAHWWVADLCANLRMQGVIGLSATTLSLVCLRRWKLVVWQLGLIGLHIPWLAAGWGHYDSSPALPLLTVTTANVYSMNRRYEDIEKEILTNDPDVVAVVELSTALKKHLSAEFQAVYPHALEQPQYHGNFGIGLYSKCPLESPRILDFTNDDIPSVSATVACDGQRIHIVATHTLPPIGSDAFAHRNRHLKLVGNHVREHRQESPDVPVVIIGDFNLTPWSPVFHSFQQESSMKSARISWTPTWYRFPVFPFGLVLDHVFTTDDLSCVNYKVGAHVGSDHRFVTAAIAQSK